jgi:hypothetical protein
MSSLWLSIGFVVDEQMKLDVLCIVGYLVGFDLIEDDLVLNLGTFDFGNRYWLKIESVPWKIKSECLYS